MKIKQYLKNLWNDLKYDESGQYALGYGLKQAAKPYTRSTAELLAEYAAKYKAGLTIPQVIAKQAGGVRTGKELLKEYQTKYSLGLTVPQITAKQAGTYTPPAVTQPKSSLTSVITGAVKQPYIPPVVTGEVTGGVTGEVTGEAGGGVFPLEEFPETPDIVAGLSGEDIARLESEAGMLSELGFAGAFRQLGQNLIESKRIATGEKAETVPVYEKSMRDVAATVANAIGNWAQKLNQLGMLRSGSYGRGISRLETAGIAERGGLQQALNERLENISTREADYERDVLDLRAGLEKEKGLNQATTFERLKREELTYQRDTRQMAFQNEVQRATFVNTMNQMIWQREMSERQLAATLEAQTLENQMLKTRIASLYGAGTAQTQGVQVSGAGTLTPAQAIEYGYAPYGEYYTQDPIVQAMMEALGVGGGVAPKPYTPGAFQGAVGSAAGYIR